MSVELGNDDTYAMKGLGSISFLVPLSDVIELNDVLFLPALKKKFISISCMIDFQCRVTREYQ